MHQTKRSLKRFLLGALLSLCCLSSHAEGAWERIGNLPASEPLVDLAACANEKDCLYAASSREIFVYRQNQWASLFSLPGLHDPIVRIHTNASRKNIWIQTRQCIYLLNSVSGISLRIYEATAPEKMPLSFSAGKEALWLGTLNGVWMSSDSGKTWQKQSALTDRVPVTLIQESSIGLFFAAGDEWRIAEEKSPQTVLKLFHYYETDEPESAQEEENEPSATPSLFHDFLETEEAFYLATTKGVFQSQNGLDWQPLPLSGIRGQPLTRLAWSPKNKSLLGISEDGFFSFAPASQVWSVKNEGLAKTNLTALASAETGGALISNSEGAWIWQESPAAQSIAKETAELFNRLTRLEPSPRAIHKHVIRYSDTGNGKIKRWHAQARASALLPSISAGKDWGTSNNIDLDRAGTNDPDRFIDGPWNRDRGADVGFSWDLGDFIFSSSQTSIDSRSKLMVDQRNDLLSEATRLFYERRRLQAGIVYTSAADEKSHWDRLLRLEELTSLIDALTNGYLSEKLEKIYAQNPEFETLWLFKG